VIRRPSTRRGAERNARLAGSDGCSATPTHYVVDCYVCGEAMEEFAESE